VLSAIRERPLRMSSFTCERRTAEPDLETGHEAGALTMLAGFACPAVVPLTGHDSGAPVGGLGRPWPTRRTRT
jgi:hypothetical protein